MTEEKPFGSTNTTTPAQNFNTPSVGQNSNTPPKPQTTSTLNSTTTNSQPKTTTPIKREMSGDLTFKVNGLDFDYFKRLSAVYDDDKDLYEKQIKKLQFKKEALEKNNDCIHSIVLDLSDENKQEKIKQEIEQFKKEINSYDSAKRILADIILFVSKNQFRDLDWLEDNSNRFLTYLESGNKKSSAFIQKEISDALKRFIRETIETKKEMFSQIRQDERFKNIIYLITLPAEKKGGKKKNEENDLLN